MLRTSKIEPCIEEYAFFVMSPLYVHAGVHYSLPDQFEIEAGPQKRIVVDYQRQVIGNVGKWSSIVEGIDIEAWDDFCHYLTTVMFVSQIKGIIWQLRYHDIDVEGTKVMSIVDPQKLPVRVRAFLPDGNKGRMQLKAGYPAKLWWDRPHQALVAAAEKILKVRGHIEDES